MCGNLGSNIADFEGENMIYGYRIDRGGAACVYVLQAEIFRLVYRDVYVEGAINKAIELRSLGFDALVFPTNKYCSIK
jgi:hypothetical protein